MQKYDKTYACVVFNIYERLVVFVSFNSFSILERIVFLYSLGGGG